MFTHTCSHCSRRQLIFPSQVTSVTDAANGIAVSFTCWCGSAQTVVTPGLVEPRREAVVAA